MLPDLEDVRPAHFAAPDPADLGDQFAAGLLRGALRIGFRSSAGPFRSLAGLSVDPRPYQLVPLLMALRQETVRLLIADDVGIGKTVEAGLIAAELLAQGDAQRLAVLCSPALAEQWQAELRDKFGITAEPVLSTTVARLERELDVGESVFDRHPNVILSTDFIKSPKYRELFLKRCPDLVIVDEAHSCVADGGASGAGRRRQQRHDLLSRLAEDSSRHLLLLTATPHSGKEDPFRSLLGLLDPKLATVDLDTDAGRAHLARHLVMRRRGDIRQDFRENALFPSDRLSQEVAYRLKPEYRRLVDKVIDYARETVRDSSGAQQQRLRWWSALALLRSLASSPRAAAQTMVTRAANAGALTPEEADAIGRAVVMDTADDEAVEAADAIPGAVVAAPESEEGDTAGTEVTATPEHDRLVRMAREVARLAGSGDAKLARLVKVVEELLDDGYHPIVFCRYIPTAEYVGEHLAGALRRWSKRTGTTAAVRTVTGTLSPEQRVARIRELRQATTDTGDRLTHGAETDPGSSPDRTAAAAERRVLVATDCLSEGVNLQEDFDAVVHYDLAWNPTRHEQRAGRVDRFGQRTDKVRIVTLYGTDNRVDGIVLDVLIRKHEQIQRATGVSVPVPDESDNVMEAVLEGLLLRGEDHTQPTLDLGLADKTEELHERWTGAAERERVSRSRYAQHAIKPAEVAAEAAEVRAALGTADEVRDFTRSALSSLRGTVVPTESDGGFTVGTGGLPFPLRESLASILGGRRPEPMVCHASPTAPRGEVALARTDPAVAAIARFVLDAALDNRIPGWQRPARRCGVIRTSGVPRRTTLLLVRYRFQLRLPTRDGGLREQVAEDARALAFRGSPADPEWLSDDEAAALFALRADGNIEPEFARDSAARVIDRLPDLLRHVDEAGGRLAARLRESHRRARGAAGARRRGLQVTAQRPADVLGVYVYLPLPSASEISR
ncbi:helicase-related protein [Streptomonospora nanhaiensis]|uniref:helicase-related protein n=1 Tax=Streptomonospora nanhaiensis TaxID=1323731 RepID=UPI0027DF38D2|nr:helicase-related protein [Streptomonospora nanhaiensis]